MRTCGEVSIATALTACLSPVARCGGVGPINRVVRRLCSLFAAGRPVGTVGCPAVGRCMLRQCTVHVACGNAVACSDSACRPCRLSRTGRRGCGPEVGVVRVLRAQRKHLLHHGLRRACHTTHAYARTHSHEKHVCVPRTCTCTHVCAHTCKHTDARAAAVKHMQHRCDPIRVAPGRFRKSLTTAVSSCSWTCTVKSQCAAWYSSYSLISAACSASSASHRMRTQADRIGSDRIGSDRIG